MTEVSRQRLREARLRPPKAEERQPEEPAALAERGPERGTGGAIHGPDYCPLPKFRQTKKVSTSAMRPESLKNKVEALASPAMAPLQDSSLADRLLYALRRRGWKPVDLDRFMAEDLRKPYHPGWTHDVLTGQTKAPRSDRLMSAAKGLRVADLWLSRNEGRSEERRVGE